tara:strand:- start:519 stop:695 length:177 start_codon:yes stop_codon:yes gene_type:complete
MKELSLFGKHNEPFALTVEETVDGERIQRDKQEEEDAIKLLDKHHGQLQLGKTTHEEI